MSLLDQIEVGLGAFVLAEARKIGELLVDKAFGKGHPKAKDIADDIAQRAASAAETVLSERAAELAAMQDATNQLATGAQGVSDAWKAAEAEGRARMSNATKFWAEPAPDTGHDDERGAPDPSVDETTKPE
jgi:hypothetical protein